MTSISFIHANDFASLRGKRMGIQLIPSIMGNVNSQLPLRICTRLRQIIHLIGG